jgi:hypothetical protein
MKKFAQNFGKKVKRSRRRQEVSSDTPGSSLQSVEDGQDSTPSPTSSQAPITQAKSVALEDIDSDTHITSEVEMELKEVLTAPGSTFILPPGTYVCFRVKQHPLLPRDLEAQSYIFVGYISNVRTLGLVNFRHHSCRFESQVFGIPSPTARHHLCQIRLLHPTIPARVSQDGTILEPYMSVAVMPSRQNAAPSRKPLVPMPDLPWLDCYHSSFTETAVRFENAEFDLSSATILPPREERRHMEYIEEDLMTLPKSSPLAVGHTNRLTSPLVFLEALKLDSLKQPLTNPQLFFQEAMKFETYVGVYFQDLLGNLFHRLVQRLDYASRNMSEALLVLAHVLHPRSPSSKEAKGDLISIIENTKVLPSDIHYKAL